METLDWPSIFKAKVLLVGENSTLQWSDEVIPHVMFLDYFFDRKPRDLGERSRFSEAKTIFHYISEITDGGVKPEEVYGTLLCKEALDRAPRGKHLLISKEQAEEGLENIKNILNKNTEIKYVFIMGLQANYYLQLLEFYDSKELTEDFLRGAEPRRNGFYSLDPFYQPINAKPFRDVCFKMYNITDFPEVQIIPILPVKSYPLSGSDLNNYGDSFERLKADFKING